MNLRFVTYGNGKLVGAVGSGAKGWRVGGEYGYVQFPTLSEVGCTCVWLTNW